MCGVPAAALQAGVGNFQEAAEEKIQLNYPDDRNDPEKYGSMSEKKSCEGHKIVIYSPAMGNFSKGEVILWTKHLTFRHI